MKTKNLSTVKQLRYDKAYLKMALEWANLSYCERKQVGALIVKDQMIISDGYNGTPSGLENVCETDEETQSGMCFMQKLMQFLRWQGPRKAQKGQRFTKHSHHVRNAVSWFTNRESKEWCLFTNIKTLPVSIF
tara:strand:- start:340 stop:738 length:399 start_codon:yes stop_codon:yes gene_type:complete